MSFTQVNSEYISVNDPDFSIDPISNTWKQKNVPWDKISRCNIFLRAGNIIDWEALKNDKHSSEVTLLILKNIKTLSSYDSHELKRIQKLYRLVNTRLKYNSDVDVENYLNNRGIDVPLIKKDFNLGIMSNYDRLYNAMPTANQNNLFDVFISQRKANRHMKPDKGFVVPIKYDSLGQVGYHGRYIADIKKPYFNSGYVKDVAKEVLFGEDNSNIQSAIKAKRQLILCKGIMDLFAVYQTTSQQALSTLSKTVSIKQFNKIKKYDVDEIIIGYHIDKYQSRFAALMQMSKLSIPVKHIQSAEDLDEQSLKSTTTVGSIIKLAQEKKTIDKESMRNAKISRRNDSLDMIRERNGIFLVKCTDIEKEITNKSTPKQIKKFLVEQSKNTIKLLPRNTSFIEIPRYNSTAVLDSFGAELRTLLFLLTKSTKTGKINYSSKQLMQDLDIGESTLGEHKRKLIKKHYLIVEKKYIGKGKTRKVHFNFYPSTLPFPEEI